MSYLQVCPQLPTSDGCPVELIWVETASAGVTASQFLQMLPAIIGILLTCWTFKQLIRMVFNNR